MQTCQGINILLKNCYCKIREECRNKIRFLSIDILRIVPWNLLDIIYFQEMLESTGITGVFGLDESIANCKGEGQPPAGYYNYNNYIINPLF